jgi:hypothetical protein
MRTGPSLRDLLPISHLTPDLRPGLIYFAPPGLGSWRFCSTHLTQRVVFTHKLKPLRILGYLADGLKAVPFKTELNQTLP